MDYEQKYKQLHKFISDLYPFMSEYCKEKVEGLIPELKESEDEKIRKWCISHFRECFRVTKDNVEYKEYLNNKVIPWLEKQGEQKLPIEKLPSEMKTIRESLEFTTQEECDEYNQIVSDYIMSDTDKSEQNPANKVEPKFKVGDEIKTANGESLTITKIDEKGYWSEDLFICGFGDAAKWELVGKSISKIDPKFHEGDWVVVSTIKGDRVVQIASVEYLKDGYPSYITTEGRWFGNGTKARLLTDKDVEIATIPESKIVVSKSKYWSEEDEDTLAAIIAIIRKQYNGTNIEEKKYYNVLINWLKSLKDRVQPQPKQEWSEKDENIISEVIQNYESGFLPSVIERDRIVKALKSLKQKIGWKPSDEQMHAFEQVYDWYNNNNFAPSETLTSLYNDLKKLKVE